METINQRIKILRTTLELKQAEFAEQLSVSRTHISNIENGNDQPSSTLLHFIIYRYGSEKWLLEGSGSMFPDFDFQSDSGVMEKYKLQRAMLERDIANSSGDALRYKVECLGYFWSLITCSYRDEDELEYLSNISKLFDMLEASVTKAALVSTYSNNERKKNNVQINEDNKIRIQNVADQLAAIQTFVMNTPRKRKKKQ